MKIGPVYQNYKLVSSVSDWLTSFLEEFLDQWFSFDKNDISNKSKLISYLKPYIIVKVSSQKMWFYRLHRLFCRQGTYIEAKIGIIFQFATVKFTNIKTSYQ